MFYRALIHSLYFSLMSVLLFALSKMRKLFVVVYPAVSVGKTVVGNHRKNKIIVTIYNELTNLLPLQ